MKRLTSILMLLFVIKLFYGPDCVEQWTAKNVSFGLGNISFTDSDTGNKVTLCGTWSVTEIKNKTK